MDQRCEEFALILDGVVLMLLSVNFASFTMRALPGSGDQRCCLRVRYCNKIGVPNAYIMSLQIQLVSHSSPGGRAHETASSRLK